MNKAKAKKVELGSMQSLAEDEKPKKQSNKGKYVSRMKYDAETKSKAVNKRKK